MLLHRDKRALDIAVSTANAFIFNRSLEWLKSRLNYLTDSIVRRKPSSCWSLISVPMFYMFTLLPPLPPHRLLPPHCPPSLPSSQRPPLSPSTPSLLPSPLPLFQTRSSPYSIENIVSALFSNFSYAVSSCSSSWWPEGRRMPHFHKLSVPFTHKKLLVYYTGPAMMLLKGDGRAVVGRNMATWKSWQQNVCWLVTRLPS